MAPRTLDARRLRIGLISDTHGLLRPEAREHLRGCQHIVHGGDIGSLRILEDLAALAPLTAVRGNNDRDEWARHLPEAAVVQCRAVRLYVIHDLSELAIDAAAEGVRVVVSGHSHQPRVEERHGVLYVNPGSAGPRRFRLPVAVGELVVEGERVEARIRELQWG
jgi:putative phosphoesterase